MHQYLLRTFFLGRVRELFLTRLYIYVRELMPDELVDALRSLMQIEALNARGSLLRRFFKLGQDGPVGIGPGCGCRRWVVAGIRRAAGIRQHEAGDVPEL